MSGILPKGQQELRKVHQVHPQPTTEQGLGSQSSGELSTGPHQKRLTQWTIIAEKAGVQNTKERLKSFWTTLGVVSALMAALTYPAVTTPAVTKFNAAFVGGDAGDPLFVSYVLLNTLSLILSFMVVIISVVLLAEVDLVVTDDDLEVFINRYQYLFLALTGVFGSSIMTIIASIIVSAFFNYNTATAIASAGICIAGTLIVAVVSAWLALWTRTRLNVHILEANALMKVAVARLRKGLGHRAAGDQSPLPSQGSSVQGVRTAGGLGAVVAVASAGGGGGGGAVAEGSEAGDLRQQPAL